MCTRICFLFIFQSTTWFFFNQEQYLREQEKLKKEWEKAQIEVEEEERKHNEEVQESNTENKYYFSFWPFDFLFLSYLGISRRDASWRRLSHPSVPRACYSRAQDTQQFLRLHQKTITKGKEMCPWSRTGKKSPQAGKISMHQSCIFSRVSMKRISSVILRRMFLHL